MKLLFVNACIRDEKSRTYELCKDFLEKFKKAKQGENWEIEELKLDELDIKPHSKESLANRDKMISENDFENEEFDFARQFIEADMVLIGAPYWDLSFPAKLKIYLERCSVTGLTFIYSPEGIPKGQCKAEKLVYLTTSGSPIADFNLGYEYVRSLCCNLFGLKETYFAAAEELDIIGKDVKKIMNDAKDKITDIVREL